MNAARNERDIGISLSADEVLSLMDGNALYDRPGVVTTDSKIEIHPLSDYEEDYSLEYGPNEDRLELARAAKVNVNLYSNGDLELYLPAITLVDVRLQNVRIPRDQIVTPMIDDPEFLTHTIPEDGVNVIFGGSLVVVDLYQLLR